MTTILGRTCTLFTQHLPRRAWRRLALGAIFAAAPSCGGEAAVAPTPRVAALVITPAAVALHPAQTAQLAVQATDGAGRALATDSVAWTSSDSTVAGVSASGVVRAGALGVVALVATSGGASDTAVVTVVPVRVAAVRVAPALLVLLVGESRQLTAAAADSAGGAVASRPVVWASSDAGVTAVSEGGVVVGRGVGSATITATVDAQRAVVAVTVVPVPVAAVRLSPSALDVRVGERRQLAVTFLDTAGAALGARAVAWASADAAVASVDAAGALVANAPGATTVSATSEGRVGRVAVAVSRVPVALVTVTPTRDTVDVGATIQFQAAVRDSAGTAVADRPVAWESSAPSLLAVSAAGVGSALAAGDVTVTAASEGVRAAARVVVRAPRVVAPDTVRVVTFGDSNTDYGYAGTDPSPRAFSYVSNSRSRPPASAPNSELQLAGKIERRWAAGGGAPIRVVNHGIGASTTGGGAHGGQNRTHEGAPHARTVVDGVTRFEAEVLGRGYPWSGGEPVSAAFPGGAVRRTRAVEPGPTSFAYVSLGTNDPAYGIAPAQTLANLQWMVDAWVGAGHRADHLVLTTLAPFGYAETFPQINAGIRALAARTGAGLIDLADHTSPDDGLTWKAAALHVGEERHYSEAVRDWLAEQVVAYARSRVPPGAP